MSTTTQVNYRRGTSAQVAAMIPSTGEIVVDLTNSRVVVGDAITLGGFTGAKLSDVTSAINILSGYVNTIVTNNSTVTALSGNLGTTGSTLTNNLFTTGSNLYNIITSASGQNNLNYATIPNLLSTGQQNYNITIGVGNNLSGNLTQTGIALINRDLFISGLLTTGLYLTGSNLYNLIIGESGQNSFNYATLTNLTLTGQTLYNRDLSISGALAALISSNAAGVGTLNGLSGALTLAGAPAGNIFTVNSGQTIFISGSGLATLSNYNSLSGALSSTGATLYSDIIGLSGVVNNSGILLQNEINTLISNYTGLSGLLTGKYLTGIIAGTNITVANNNNGTFTINSTASGSGGGTVNSTGTGAYIFSIIPTSGISQQFVSFPSNLGSSPYVIPYLSNISGNENIHVQTSGITSSGFWATYSNTIDSSGYLLTTFAALSANTGLATTVIIQNTIITGLSSLNSVLTTGNQNIFDIKNFNIIGVTGKISGSASIYDSNNLKSIDFNSRNLFNQGGSLVIDYQNEQLLSSVGTVVDWANGVLNDLTSPPQLSVWYSNRQLYDTGTNISIDWQNRILSGNWNVQSISIPNIVYLTGSQTIGGHKRFSGDLTVYDVYPSGIGYTGISGLVYRTGVSGKFITYGKDNNISLDIYNRILSGNWNTQMLVTHFLSSNSNSAFIDLNNETISDSLNHGTSIDWGNRLVYDINVLPSLDWNNRTLSGIWAANGIAISGNPVLTGLIAGSNITVNNNNNGTFTINGNAGGGGGGFVTGVSGSCIFSSRAISGVTTQFINFPASLGPNPYVICQLSNYSGIENIVSQASGITSSGFWANYSNVIDGSGYILTTIASLSTQTGLATTVIINNNISTGIFNPVWNNLSWGNTTNWNTNNQSVEDKAILTLTGNTTLSINSLFNGWNGVLEVIQSGISTTGYTLTLPALTRVINAGSGLANLTMTSGAIDMLGFSYNGTNLFLAIGNNFT